jgi:nucleotide-binding universal stress UspA family protein
MKILCPVDRSNRDGTTLRYAKDLAKGLSATIVVVEAVPAVHSLLKAAVHQAEGYVAAVESGLRDEGFDVEGIVRKGDPAKVILSLVTDLHADMVIMTTRNRSGLGKVVLGSVTHEILAASPKPVVLLKEDLSASLAGEDVELQSAYVAAILWNKRVKGILTQDEVTDEMLRLSKSGLDRNVLYQTYMGYEEVGKPADWLDLDFQLSTLRKFLPDDVETPGEGAEPPSQSNAA